MIVRGFKIFLAVILIFSVLFFLNKFFYSGTRNAVNFLFSPLQRFFWQEGSLFSRAIESVFEAEKIRREIEAMRKENFILISQNEKLKGLKEENVYLKEALAIKEERGFSVIEARFVSKDPQEERIVLNRGEKNGVAKGMIVATKEKVLVGIIEQVFSSFSVVSLITEKDFKFSVSFGEEEKFSAAARGTGRGVDLEFIPKEAEIKKGEIVSTSVLGGIFPEGFLVGETEKTERNDAEPFQSASLLPYFLSSDLKILFILSQ